MKKLISFIIACSFIISVTVPSIAADKSGKTAPAKKTEKGSKSAPAKKAEPVKKTEPQKKIDPKLKKASDLFAPKFKALEKWLRNAPPPDRDPAKREAMLKTIDRAMSHKDALKLDSAGDFFQARMKVFIDDYLTTDPGADTLVWKLYNHTEIIHTKDIHIAVDLIQGFEKLTLSKEMLKTIVDNTDVLLLTHSHGDHADRRVVDAYISAGRPVVAPEIFWKDYNRNDRITVLREGMLIYPGAKIRVYPAFQKEEENNVYLITTANGVTVMHIGDNNNISQAGHEWFRKFKKPLKIDALIPNIWSPDLFSLLKFVKPEVLIASHEHELGHPVSGRRTYGYVYNVLKTVKQNSVVPAWGEYIRIKGKKK